MNRRDVLKAAAIVPLCSAAFAHSNAGWYRLSERWPTPGQKCFVKSERFDGAPTLLVWTQSPVEAMTRMMNLASNDHPLQRINGAFVHRDYGTLIAPEYDTLWLPATGDLFQRGGRA